MLELRKLIGSFLSIDHRHLFEILPWILLFSDRTVHVTLGDFEFEFLLSPWSFCSERPLKTSFHVRGTMEEGSG